MVLFLHRDNIYWQSTKVFVWLFREVVFCIECKLFSDLIDEGTSFTAATYKAAWGTAFRRVSCKIPTFQGHIYLQWLSVYIQIVWYPAFVRLSSTSWNSNLQSCQRCCVLYGIFTILHVSRTYTFAMAKCTYSLLCGVLNLFVKYIMKSICMHILLEMHLAYFALLFSYA